MTSTLKADTDPAAAHLIGLPIWLLVSIAIAAVGLAILFSCTPGLRRINIATDPEEGGPGCLCLFLYIALLLLAVAFYKSVFLGFTTLACYLLAGW